MPKLPRKVQKVFGNAIGATGQFGVYGSLAAASPQYSKDPKVIQSLAAWELGLAGAVVGNKSPALEDINSLFYTAFYQLACLLESGVPEWDMDTPYFIDDFASSGGKIYKSKTDDNLNNAIGDTNHWIEYVASVYTPPAFTLQKSYLFSDRQVLATVGSSVGWTAIDLTPYIAAAGLNVPGITVTGAKIGLRVQLGPNGFGTYTADAIVYAWGNSTATNPLFAYTLQTADDSSTSSSDTTSGDVPLLGGTNLFYNVGNNGRASGLFAQVFLSGFIYDQVVQL